MKYRKKPVIVEAYQTDKEVVIHTLEGDMKANIGDYIITSIKGEQYPCKPEVFEQTYEVVTNNTDAVLKSESLPLDVHEALKQRAVEKAKIELVREIFEEIEAEITAALKSNYEARKAYNPTDEFHMWVQGKIDALGGIEYFIAELKKKYAEE